MLIPWKGVSVEEELVAGARAEPVGAVAEAGTAPPPSPGAVPGPRVPAGQRGHRAPLSSCLRSLWLSVLGCVMTLGVQHLCSSGLVGEKGHFEMFLYSN